MQKYNQSFNRFIHRLCFLLILIFTIFSLQINVAFAHGTAEEHVVEGVSQCGESDIITKPYLPDPHKDLRLITFGLSFIGLVMSIFCYIYVRLKKGKHNSKKKSLKSSDSINDSINFNIPIVIMIIGLILFIGLPTYHFWRFGFSKESIIFGPIGSQHIHADFKVFIEDQPFDFGIENYMSNEDMTVSNYVHLHDSAGDLMHIHANGITFGYFFETLNFKLTKKCLTFDTGQNICNEGDKKWRFYVNGKLNNDFEDYVITDNDKLLLIYGLDSKEKIIEQYQSMSNKACIYSKTCEPPEGFVITPESCGA